MLWAVRAARVVCGTLCLWLNGWRWRNGVWGKLHSTVERRPFDVVAELIDSAYIGHVNSKRWLGHSGRCVVVRRATLLGCVVLQTKPHEVTEYVIEYELEVLSRPNYAAETTDFEEVFV